MKNALILTLITAGMIAVAAFTVGGSHSQAATISHAAPTPPTAISQDITNPCDPTPGILSQCKANHGHFSYKCCCCVTH